MYYSKKKIDTYFLCAYNYGNNCIYEKGGNPTKIELGAYYEKTTSLYFLIMFSRFTVPKRW